MLRRVDAHWEVEVILLRSDQHPAVAQNAVAQAEVLQAVLEVARKPLIDQYFFEQMAKKKDTDIFVGIPGMRRCASISRSSCDFQLFFVLVRV